MSLAPARGEVLDCSMKIVVRKLAVAGVYLAACFSPHLAFAQDHSEEAKTSLQSADEAEVNNSKFCEMWFPNEAEAQADCVVKQSNGYKRVIAVRDAAALRTAVDDPTGKATGTEILTIIDTCLQEWFNAGLIEYRMVAYCTETEIRKLR